MHIFIPTYGRSSQQHTFQHLPKALQKRTTLVVQRREAHLYDNYSTWVLPKDIQTISPARQYIMDQAKKNKLDPHFHYCGRPCAGYDGSYLGNPYRVGKYTLEEALRFAPVDA